MAFEARFRPLAASRPKPEPIAALTVGRAGGYRVAIAVRKGRGTYG